MLKEWFAVDPAQDGEFWALNLMKYRPIADYSDGRETTITGMEADDLYNPVGPLEAIGAMIAFGANVTDQLDGTPAYDRVAIVRYPSRAGFFDMQRREDFQALHEHKDAGMEFTIVMSCLPESHHPDNADAEGSLLLRVRRHAQGTAPAADPEGFTPLVRFSVEGAMIGDGSTWDEALFDIVSDEALASLSSDGLDGQVAVVLDTPIYDSLLESIETASV
jgi:hypothetical protein